MTSEYINPAIFTSFREQVLAAAPPSALTKNLIPGLTNFREQVLAAVPPPEITKNLIDPAIFTSFREQLLAAAPPSALTKNLIPGLTNFREQVLAAVPPPELTKNLIDPAIFTSFREQVLGAALPSELTRKAFDSAFPPELRNRLRDFADTHALTSSAALTAAAAQLRLTNSTTAAMLSTVASQRLVGGGDNSFDRQFRALSDHIDALDIPTSVQARLSEVVDDQETIQSVTANMGLSAVPDSCKERWILSLLAGFAMVLLYGFTQAGMTNETLSPALAKDSLEAGATTVVFIRWAPEALRKLRGGTPE